MLQDVLERLGQLGVSIHSGYRSWKQWVQLRAFCDLLDGGVLGRSKRQEMGGDPVEVTMLDSLESLVLVQVEVVQVAALLFLGLPHTVNNILNTDTVVGLAVTGISEGHQRRVDLRNRGEGQMGRPVLNKDHVAREHACGIGATLNLC